MDGEGVGDLLTLSNKITVMSNERLVAGVLGIVSAVGLIVLSFLDEQEKTTLHTAGRYHEWGHFLCFAFVTFLLTKAIRSAGGKIMLTFGMVLTGCSVEVLQHLIWQQPIEFRDIQVDALGALIGLMTVLFLDAMSNVSRVGREI